jgi:hypothetical protein
MEFVEGETLAAWCSGAQRTWREILDVFELARQISPPVAAACRTRT